MIEEIQIHTRIQSVISSFKTEMETTVFGSIPEVVIDFVLKAKIGTPYFVRTVKSN